MSTLLSFVGEIVCIPLIVKKYYCENHFTPTKAINLLANHTYSEIQTSVAKYPKTSEQALLKLYLNHGYTFS